MDFPTRGGAVGGPVVRVLPVTVSLVALLGACDMGPPNSVGLRAGSGAERLL